MIKQPLWDIDIPLCRVRNKSEGRRDVIGELPTPVWIAIPVRRESVENRGVRARLAHLGMFSPDLRTPLPSDDSRLLHGGFSCPRSLRRTSVLRGESIAVPHGNCASDVGWISKVRQRLLQRRTFTTTNSVLSDAKPHLTASATMRQSRPRTDLQAHAQSNLTAMAISRTLNVC